MYVLDVPGFDTLAFLGSRLDLADSSKQILFPKAVITADGITDHWINEQEFLEMT